MRKEDRIVRYKSNQERKRRELFIVRETCDSSYAEGNTPAEREHFLLGGQGDAAGRTSTVCRRIFQRARPSRDTVYLMASVLSIN